jgi:mannonate dehydratase
MNRRQFFHSSGAAALAASASTPTTASAAGKPILMKLGCQSAPTNDKHVAYFARYGVRNICGYPVIADQARLFATTEELKKMLEITNKYDVKVDCLAPPFLESSHIDRTRHTGIMLAQSPEREREVEAVHNMIKNCAEVGIPSIKYNMSLLGVLRVPERTKGRGDAMLSTWSLQRAKPQTPLTKAGPVNADQYWERITWFLEKVIPVANEYKIRMACHPHDPGVPPEGYQGIDAVLGTVNGLKKFVSIKESPYHGLNFCQGTVSEMLAEPGKEIYDVIRYFGSRKKIFNVHFRNIRGHRNEFVEVYPDEGDVDFVKAIQTYREVEYPYMLMPDHVPVSPDDPGGLQSFAFCYGYIRGLLQFLEHTA